MEEIEGDAPAQRQLREDRRPPVVSSSSLLSISVSGSYGEIWSVR